MSKSTMDSDLYGDIYGDDEPETVEPDSEQVEPEQATLEPVASSSSSSLHSSLPAKSSTPAMSSSPSSMSYSAQIAQQFSAYQQTPSQERQQRTEHPLPQRIPSLVDQPQKAPLSQIGYPFRRI
ncbi:hypothetical protein C8J56DRAFT_949312 [Mycena floridula]|nr:hypothetical protein C8J56DRAFT_949312 [Mycena floridula]